MFSVQRHSCAYCEKPIAWPKIVNVALLPPPVKCPKQQQQRRKTFKERRSLEMRKMESAEVRSKFLKKVPVIVEKSDREKVLPYLDRVKFLVPLDMTMSQFVGIVRTRLKLKPTQTFYLMLNNRSVATMSRYMGDIYDEYKDEDGFLYCTYAAQEMYG
ncbi:microtubule-associated proteins 1A/1B light chain 3C-like [Argiope bruennichi]|uniref:Microtubule-associated proteins 1A/1B light like protein n=1 Tax=Argiope bruennichi TaxID=94029 RepID=A0A8T0ED54_ARGBR|nr:microtubule-associated proteins 1A/1B light chain 3C-like [Argiope bruennichi]KAF8770791.1 Microtubule-associated proteins 1A/1B light like protein [Argiope bruennichi]